MEPVLSGLRQGQRWAFVACAGVPLSFVVGSILICIGTGISWLWGVFIVLLQFVLFVYGIVVLWNPSVAALLYGITGPSNAAQRLTEKGSTDWAHFASSRETVNAIDYYKEYHGHPVRDLAVVHAALKRQGCSRFVWMMGDSSLDNKHWLFQSEFQTKEQQLRRPNRFSAPAMNGYDKVLVPPTMVQDVSYWLNKLAEEELGRAQVWIMPR